MYLKAHVLPVLPNLDQDMRFYRSGGRKSIRLYLLCVFFGVPDVTLLSRSAGREDSVNPAITGERKKATGLVA